MRASFGVLLSLLKSRFFQSFPVFTSLTTYTVTFPTTKATCYCWSSLSPLSGNLPVFLPSRADWRHCVSISTSHFYWETSWLSHNTSPKNLQWSVFIVEWQAALTSLFKGSNLRLLIFLEGNRRLMMVHLYWKSGSLEFSVFHTLITYFCDISWASLALWMCALLCTAVSLQSILAATMIVLIVVRCAKMHYFSSRKGWVSLLL